MKSLQQYTIVKIICPNKKRKECKEYIINKILEELIKII